MKYYYIRNSLNKKVIGHYPQVKEVKYNCHVWNDPLFIDRFHFVKITVQPIVANAIIYAKAKLTDLIDSSSMGFTSKLLISDKLKSILESKRATGMQFFKSSVFRDGNEFEKFWVLHTYEFNMEYINFSKSKIIVRIKKKQGGTELKIVEVSSMEEFLKLTEFHKQKMEIVSIENICLNSDVKEDFFFIKTAGQYIVSEKLKEEIEEVGCTGIEFQPIELSFNEWTSLGGEREKIYGKT